MADHIWTPEAIDAACNAYNDEQWRIDGMRHEAYAEGRKDEREDLMRSVLRCRYPVARAIDPGGYGWDTPRLNEVISALCGNDAETDVELKEKRR